MGCSCLFFAFSSLLRVSELATIDRNSILIDADSGASFLLLKPMKAIIQEINISSVQDDLICPVAYLRRYVLRTDAFRPQPGSSHLFLALLSPSASIGQHGSSLVQVFYPRPVSDTRLFPAHSIRSASASAAFRSGSPIDSYSACRALVYAVDF